MKKITSLTSILILFFITAFAQSPSNIKDLEESYTEYFSLNREIVYLHLNKNAVVPNEDLWLSAYIYDVNQNIPNKDVANLDLNIYNTQGKLVNSKTMLVSGGKGSISLNLDPNTYNPGKYYIEASTNYMNNFEEDLFYVQSFTIIGEETNTLSSQVTYDLQILPEGGHLVSNVINTVGVKLIDKDGLGASFKNAKLVNSKNEEIGSFKSNKFGVAKFNLIPTISESYSVILETEAGDKVKENLPKSSERGISLGSIDRNNDFIFSLNTNEETRSSLDNQKFIFAIHKDGSIKNFEFIFPEDKLEATLTISKDSLFSGVNTITIFNSQFQPVLERLIFNEKNIKRSRITASKSTSRGDSLTIGLKSDFVIENNSLSISILPGQTKAYDPSHNIISAFYLKPYLKGTIENATYYFEDGDSRRKAYDLDLLLLTQGWSKYTWENIFTNPIQELYKPHVGFAIDGNIGSRINKNQNSLFIKSEETGLFEIVEIKSDNSFRLDNVYIEDSTQISIGILNDKNSKVTKPSISFIISPQKKLINSRKNFNHLDKKLTYNLIDTESFVNVDNTLDTINLQGVRKDTERYRNDTRSYQEEVKISDEIASRYLYVTDYIATKGFRVRRIPTGVEIINPLPFSIRDGASQKPLIVFNGAPIFDNAEELLIDLQTSQVESIVINKRGVGYGMQGGNGVIKITTKKGAGTRGNMDTINTIIAKNGFSTDKEFYAPRYSSYTSNAFNNYGAIGWFSNVNLDENGKASFKVLNTLQPNLRIFIEGMNSSGHLISEELLIQTR